MRARLYITVLCPNLHHPTPLAFGGFFLQDDTLAASLQLDQDQGVVEVLSIRAAVARVVSSIHLHHQDCDLVPLKSWAELQAWETYSGVVRRGPSGTVGTLC